MANERQFSSIKLYFFFFFQSTRETALKGCFLLYQDGGGQGGTTFLENLVDGGGKD